MTMMYIFLLFYYNFVYHVTYEQDDKTWKEYPQILDKDYRYEIATNLVIAQGFFLSIPRLYD